MNSAKIMAAHKKNYICQFPLQLGMALWLNSG